jgi:hypothetical protein
VGSTRVACGQWKIRIEQGAVPYSSPIVEKKTTYVHLLLTCIWSRHWFLLRIFPFTWLDSLILTTDIWNEAHGGCDRSAGDVHSSTALDPTFTFVGGPFCPTFDFVLAFCIMITFYTLMIRYFVLLNFWCNKFFYWFKYWVDFVSIDLWRNTRTS